MAGMASVGDILMLSQLAWKIECAFTSGQTDAPAEFEEVEYELRSLSKSLTLLAECLDESNTTSSRADRKTKEVLLKILSSCRETLEHVNSIVIQYQELKSPAGDRNTASSRFWKPLLIENYRTLCWTSEGGTIRDLRNMLHMHTNSISLTMLALQR